MAVEVRGTHSGRAEADLFFFTFYRYSKSLSRISAAVLSHVRASHAAVVVHQPVSDYIFCIETIVDEQQCIILLIMI